MKELLRTLASIEMEVRFHPDQHDFVAYIYTFHGGKFPIMQFNGKYKDVVNCVQGWADNWVAVKAYCEKRDLSFDFDGDAVVIYPVDASEGLTLTYVDARDISGVISEINECFGVAW